MTNCPCGSEADYQQCCGPYIEGTLPAPTAEALLRARFTAFSRGAIDYLMDTVHPDKSHTHNRLEIEAWSRDSDWRSLEILRTLEGGEDDDCGMIEFIATYRNREGIQRHHEKADFHKAEGIWYFYDGARPKMKPLVHATPKVGRNEPCPCGSGKKHKKCCGR